MNIKQLLSNILKRSDDGQRPQAGTRFGLSWPLLTALCLVLVCAVGWAFFMGLMVGRGQNPQASIHAATGLMKPDEAPGKPAKSEENEADPVFEHQSPPAPPVVMPAREAPKKAQPVREAPRKPAPKPNAPEQRYAYTFQAGAFRAQADAKAASDRLNRAGLKTTVQKSGKVWLAIIALRGGPAEVAKMREKVKELKMDRPMQLTKTAIETKKRKRG